MKPREKVSNPRANKQGVSLIELMITAIILAIIALAGGAVIHLSRSALATQRDKHAALTEAIRIMELARIAIDLRGENGPFFEGANGLTLIGSPPWQLDINGRLQNITVNLATTGVSPYLTYESKKFTKISVSIDYKDGLPVILESIITDSD